MGRSERFKAVFNRFRNPPDERHVPTSSNTSRAFSGPRPPSESREGPEPPTAGPTSSPEDLSATEPKARLDAWSKAYDDLKNTDPKLVGEYERLLIQEAGAIDAPDQNASSPLVEGHYADHKRRRQQMEEIAQTALDRTEKEARGMKGAEEVMGVVDLARQLGAPVIQAFPQAALPWAGVCAALQLFKNPLTESKAQRDGTVQVIARMKWYCELENRLSRKIDNGKESDLGLLALLEDKIVTLFTALLDFLMRSVCSYFKNRILASLRNALKLGQWEESLKEIKSSEEAIYRDVGYQSLTEVNSNLEQILAFAKEKESQFFESVLTVMQAQLTLQLSQLDQECLKDVLLQDPRIAKEEIEDVKGGLFEESCEWVFENDDFRKWHEEDESRALWIHGDPGKGKTMLLCGIVNSMQRALPKTDTLSYFFCQADQPKSNTFTAVLRGLVYDLARERPDLIRYIREVYDVKGSKLFTDTGSWADLSTILTRMVSALSQGTTYLLIDALDECQEDRDRLMKFIINQTAEQPKLRWVVTSRNWISIESAFEKKEAVRSLSLEKNADPISLAVCSYINYQIDNLAREKGYDDDFRSHVENHLLPKAEETYLWVALVCKALRDTEGDSLWAEEALNEFPGGLDDLYGKMMNQVTQGKQAELCRQVLSCLALVHRPITLLELVVCIDLTPTLRSRALSEERLASLLKSIVNFCGSFLKIRNETIYFVHQSAKEYLNSPHAEAIFPDGVSHAHHEIFHRSITSLMKGLHRDMYHVETPASLDSFGISIDDVRRPDKNSLSAISYSCVYWIDHLESGMTETDPDILLDGDIQNFLKTRFIYWLEALSLLGAINEGIASLGKLLEIVRSQNSDSTKGYDLINHVQDARQFLLFHASTIRQFPLQTYASALVFSPTQSLVRKSFKRDMPAWVNCAYGVKEDWEAACHTFQQDDFKSLGSVALSQNERYIAMASRSHKPDGIEVYERATSRHVRTIRTCADGYQITRLAFSHDDEVIVYTTVAQVSIVNINTGQCLQTIDLKSQHFHSICFSGDNAKVVAQGQAYTDRRSGFLYVWDRHSNDFTERTDLGFVLAYHSKRDICLTDEAPSYTVRNFASGNIISKFHLESQPIQLANFSPDGKIIAIWAGSIQILDSSSGKLLRAIPSQDTIDYPWAADEALCISNDNRLLAHTFKDAIVVTDTTTGMCLQTLKTSFVDSLRFINNAQQLFTCSTFPPGDHQPIRIWDVTHSASKSRKDVGRQVPDWLHVSPDAHYIVGCTGTSVEVVDLNKNSRHTLATVLHPEQVHCVTADGKTFFVLDNEAHIQAFNIKTRKLVRTIEMHFSPKSCFTSSDGRFIATVTDEIPGSSLLIALWCVLSGKCVHTFKIGDEDIEQFAYPYISFSSNRGHVVCMYSKLLLGWDVSTGKPEFRIEESEEVRDFAFFNRRKSILVSTHSGAWIRSLPTGQLESTIKPPPDLLFVRCIISQDDKLAAWLIDDKAIWIWDMEKNVFRWAFRSPLTSLVNLHSNTLSTTIGDIVLEEKEDAQLPEVPLSPKYAGLSHERGHDCEWISWNGAKLLALPEGYHAEIINVTVRKQVVAIGCEEGIVILKFKIE